MKEKIYIMYRKVMAGLSSLCFYICRVFPIENNLIAVCTFEGKGGFGCNPKYIVQELHRQHPEYKFIWFVSKDLIDRKEFPEYIRKVKNNIWSRAYWLTRAHVWIDNYRKPYGTVKRKGQYYVNTWHANMGFKSIGLWRGDAFSKMAYLVSKNDSDMIDVITIDSNYCEIMFRKGLVYTGEYLKVGQPRCDILYGNRNKERTMFRERHGLSLESKVLLFAPTFRENIAGGKRKVYSEISTIDFEKVLEAFTERFGGEWHLCVRVHPQLAASTREHFTSDKNTKIIDISYEDDMNENLAAVDAFITDYSSAAFEAGYCDTPVFIYADDLQKYSNDRGSLLWDFLDTQDGYVHNNKKITPQIDTILPFTLAQTNYELVNNILNYNEYKYRMDLNRMKEDIGLVFDGHSNAAIAERIIQKMEG